MITTCYGLFPGGDPRLFKPDAECCTADEIARHATACKEWDADRGIVRGPFCSAMGDGSAWAGKGFGIGTYEIEIDDGEGVSDELDF